MINPRKRTPPRQLEFLTAPTEPMPPVPMAHADEVIAAFAALLLAAAKKTGGRDEQHQDHT